jgi:hypothetical protein
MVPDHDRVLDVLVVGAGPWGLATAIAVVLAGHKATVFELHDQPYPFGLGILCREPDCYLHSALKLPCSQLRRNSTRYIYLGSMVAYLHERVDAMLRCLTSTNFHCYLFIVSICKLNYFKSATSWPSQSIEAHV